MYGNVINALRSESDSIMLPPRNFRKVIIRSYLGFRQMNKKRENKK
jgi:hypothetical protein